jgi:hypothetical protein
MTADSPALASDARSPSAPHPSTGLLAAWLAAQLLLVTLAAVGVPLAARYADPPEQFAPHLLLCGQVVVASLLFPWILRDPRTAAQVLSAALPFQVAATFLGGSSLREVAPAIAYVDGFVLALAVWAPLLRSPLTESLGVAVASCLTLGGGMLRYLRVEYSGGTAAADPRSWETVTPLPSTVAAIEGNLPTAAALSLVALAAIGITIRLLRRRRVASHDATL